MNNTSMEDLFPIGLKFKGKYQVKHFDKDGVLKGTYDIDNDVGTVGKTALLDSFFRNQTQPAAWYIGIIDNSGFTALAVGDTMASHSGWNEFTTYSQSTRVAWGPDAASAASITNGTKATFDITGSGTLKGIFVNSVSTKSGTTGTLWSTAAFAATVAVVNGDSLKITYTLSC